MMKQLQNERGVALITSLLLTLISLAIVLAVLYLVTQSIQVSGSSKVYRNAREASYATADIMAKEIIPELFLGKTTTELATTFSAISLDFGSYPSCLQQKLTNPTVRWGTTTCGPNASTMDPKNYYDLKFTLKGLPLQGNYTVYSQIVSTVAGNSDMSGNTLLDAALGVTQNNPGISPMHIPSLYTIEVHGEKDTNPVENARLSVLYAY